MFWLTVSQFSLRLLVLMHLVSEHQRDYNTFLNSIAIQEDYKRKCSSKDMPTMNYFRQREFSYLSHFTNFQHATVF